MGKTVFLLLAGCSAEFSLAAAVEVESDAAVDAAALEAAAVDRGSADAALSDAAVTPDAAAPDAAAPDSTPVVDAAVKCAPFDAAQAGGPCGVLTVPPGYTMIFLPTWGRCDLIPTPSACCAETAHTCACLQAAQVCGGRLWEACAAADGGAPISTCRGV